MAPTRETGYTTTPAASVPVCVEIVWVMCRAILRGPRAISAGFHHTAPDPNADATTAWPIATDRAPIGNRKSCAPSVALAVCADASRAMDVPTHAAMPAARRHANPSRRVTLERCCLVDQHDRDVVSNRVPKLAGVADERRFSLTIFELTFALGADENGEELRRHTHDDRSSGMLYPKRWSARIFRRQLGSTLTHRSR